MIARKRKLAGMEKQVITSKSQDVPLFTEEQKDALRLELEKDYSVKVRPANVDKKTNTNYAYDILSGVKTITLLDVIERFEEELKHRPNVCEVFFLSSYLPDHQLAQIAKAGFRYRMHVGPIGETIHVISLV